MNAKDKHTLTLKLFFDGIQFEPITTDGLLKVHQNSIFKLSSILADLPEYLKRVK